MKLWDVTARDGYPVCSYVGGHKEDVAGVDWNLVSKDSFCTAGWDGAVCVRTVPCRVCVCELGHRVYARACVRVRRCGPQLVRSQCCECRSTAGRCTVLSGARTLLTSPPQHLVIVL